MGPTTVFLVTSDDPERLLRVGLWALTAASVGEHVDVLLGARPLASLAAGRLDESPPALPGAPSASTLSLPGPLGLLRQARELGPCRVLACDTELRLAGLDPDSPPTELDGVVSLPTFWREALAARLVHV